VHSRSIGKTIGMETTEGTREAVHGRKRKSDLLRKPSRSEWAHGGGGKIFGKANI